jgi:hypothetical protein
MTTAVRDLTAERLSIAFLAGALGLGFVPAPFSGFRSRDTKLTRTRTTPNPIPPRPIVRCSFRRNSAAPVTRAVNPTISDAHHILIE